MTTHNKSQSRITPSWFGWASWGSSHSGLFVDYFQLRHYQLLPTLWLIYGYTYWSCVGGLRTLNTPRATALLTKSNGPFNPGHSGLSKGSCSVSGLAPLVARQKQILANYGITMEDVKQVWCHGKGNDNNTATGWLMMVNN